MKTLKDKKFKNITDAANAIRKGKKTYLKRPRSWQKIHLYWENKDKWFLNVSYEKRIKGQIKRQESSWIIEKDLDKFLKLMCGQERYEIYST